MSRLLSIEKFIKSIDKSGNYLFVILISTGLVHCLFLAIFTILDIEVMALINLISCFIYVLIVTLAAKGRYDIAGPLAFVEILVHQILGFYFCGPFSGFHYLLMCLLLAQFGMLKQKQLQIIGSVLIITSIVASYFITNSGVRFFSNLYYSSSAYAHIHKILNPLNICLCLAFMIVYGLIANANHSGKIDDLLNLVYKDFLTGLYNRKFLEERAWQQLLANKNLLVAICDIDNFKKINDTYGHTAGDLVLKYTSMIMQKAKITQGDKSEIFIGRWGGEEFVILADFESSKEAIEFLERIRKDINEHKFLNIDEKVSITIGAITSVKDPKIPLNFYIQEADELLYQGKKTSKNIVVSKSL